MDMRRSNCALARGRSLSGRLPRSSALLCRAGPFLEASASLKGFAQRHKENGRTGALHYLTLVS